MIDEHQLVIIDLVSSIKKVMDEYLKPSCKTNNNPCYCHGPEYEGGVCVGPPHQEPNCFYYEFLDEKLKELQLV